MCSLHQASLTFSAQLSPAKAQVPWNAQTCLRTKLFWGKVRAEVLEGFYLLAGTSAWARAGIQHMRSRAGAEQQTKEVFRQETLLSQMDPSFVLRRGKVTIKPQLTLGIWTSLPWNPPLQHQSLLHLWAAGYSFSRSTCMCWIHGRELDCYMVN